jgi:membrane fusion protein (multidrug efflux system)
LLADGSVYPQRGVVVAVDRQVDATTGTITLQALIPNPDGLLRPGQYGRVRLPRGDEGREVKSGLSEGETIVVEGVQKISDGAQVRPEPVPAEPAAAPAPGASGDAPRAAKPGAGG